MIVYALYINAMEKDVLLDKCKGTLNLLNQIWLFYWG